MNEKEQVNKDIEISREKASEEKSRKRAMKLQENSKRNNADLFQKEQMEYDQRRCRRGR